MSRKRKKRCSGSPWNASERYHFSYISNNLPSKATRGAPNLGILYIPCFILGFLMDFSNSKSCVYREDSEGWARRQSSGNSANKQHFSSSLPRIKSFLGQGKSQCALKWVGWHRNLHLLTGGFKRWIISCKKCAKVGKWKATDSACGLLEECERTLKKWENRRAGRRMLSGKQNNGKQMSQNPNQEVLKQNYRTP